ncbi:MAG: competence/damage-inducible protein A [Eubacteriaceae bacterium]|nr:competence/damage-inducible protein A [Eubacteriaceae bacterium]
MTSKIKNCVIIAVGDEVLYGDTVNTNGAYIARAMDDIGIRTLYQLTVADNSEVIIRAVKEALSRSELILLCGGLGPTADDITKQSLSEALGLKMVLDEPTMERNRRFFESYKLTMTPNNEKQAYLPEGSVPIPNANGTAPGVFLEKGGKYFMLLPGPPAENTPMLTEYIIPKLRELSEADYAEKYYMLYPGQGESAAEALIRDNIETGEDYTLNTYVGEGSLRLKATAYAKSAEEAQRLIEKKDKQIKSLFAGRIIAQENREISDMVCEALIRENITVSCAESCTGGLIAAKFTDFPGISAVFMGGAVTYSNRAKMDILGVNPKTIEEFTEVSEQTAMEMASGAARIYKTDAALSTTGIAGPTGGSAEKPVGLVYTGIYYKGKTSFIRSVYRGNRQKVRQRAVAGAFELLFGYVLGRSSE